MKYTHFKARAYAPFKISDVDVIGHQCLDVMIKNGGELTPESLLDYAQGLPPENPLYNCFTWNNDEAAHKQRLQEARQVINHIEIEYIDDDDNKQSGPLFINIKNEENHTQTYFDVNTINENDAYKKQALKNAKKEMEIWERRYKWISDLHNIMELVKNEFEKIN